MILYPQISVTELHNDKNGERIDVSKIPGVERYEVNTQGEVFRLYMDYTTPGANKALSYIRSNKVCVIDKRYIKARQRGGAGIDFDSPFKTACLYVASAAAIAAPFVIAGYYTGKNTGDWEHAYRLFAFGISAGISVGMGATMLIREHFSHDMDRGFD